MSDKPSRRRVLIVDDEPSILKMVGKRLEVAGYDVMLAQDGEEGLAEARVGSPDIILLDLMLPRKNGFEVCAILKGDPASRHVPVVIFTARGDEADERLCREVGADAYISKPRGMGPLLEQVEALLARFSQDGGPADAT